MKIKISIIIPFYNGNKYMEQLFSNLTCVANKTIDIAEYEIVIVNDSPWIDVVLPQTDIEHIVIKNDKNMGVQYSRINGLKVANGEWILFLDQDDEIVFDGFRNQITCANNADVVVGNGIYKLGNVNKQIYSNINCMDYLLRLKMFIGIRNLIPSPGECLIRKNLIPEIWKNNYLTTSGADDWLLWILLFKTGAKFCPNADLVYIHNDSNGENLSSNLYKMKDSSLEMADILENNSIISSYESCVLKESIKFKHAQDTKKLGFDSLIRMRRAFLRNVFYRIWLNLLNVLYF